ncbi:MAG: hypothetical protein COA32_11210 [Fluviicola sp.]|nr:MAG: hypothetical protein COA32_11210 [Fluviicola sp.]
MKIIRYIILFLIISCSFQSSAQKLFHQDIFYGGVTAAGFSTGIGAWWPEDTITVQIEPGSTIRNAWMFVYSMGYPDELSIVLDGELVEIDTSIHLLSTFTNTNPQSNPVRIYAVDIKSIVEPTKTDYPIEILAVGHPEINWGWWSPVLYIEYNNSSLSKVTTSLWYNDIDLIGLENYNFTGLNSIDFSQDVGFSLFTDRVGNFNPYDIFINSTQIGEFNQNDSYNTSTWGVGVQGHFYYQNNTLFGLGDDVPNTTMYGSDGIALINSYLSSGDTGYDLKMEHHQNPSSPGNQSINLIFPHTYTTPCDTFSTQIIADTSVCIGDSIQLFASGGNNYEWLNTQGVSNPNIFNPMVSPDSTQLYVVRIENEPGCFRTEKVLVEVHENPIIETLDITPEICGESNGEVTVVASGKNPFSYTLGGGTQTSATFSNLLSDNYTLIVTDDNGCTTDSSFVLPQEIGVDASFTANPETGYEPLSVQFTNTTQNATDYEWFIDNAFWDNTTHTSAYFDSAGVYDVMLYAYNNLPACVDSFALKIIVEDTMIVRIPNVFTPNGDFSNDNFTIDVRRAKEIKATILNRWGNVMHEAQEKSNGTEQTITIWNGEAQNQPATEGTYFYKFEITDVKGEVYVYQGFFHLVRD